MGREGTRKGKKRVKEKEQKRGMIGGMLDLNWFDGVVSWGEKVC